MWHPLGAISGLDDSADVSRGLRDDRRRRRRQSNVLRRRRRRLRYAAVVYRSVRLPAPPYTITAVAVTETASHGRSISCTCFPRFPPRPPNTVQRSETPPSFYPSLRSLRRVGFSSSVSRAQRFGVHPRMYKFPVGQTGSIYASTTTGRENTTVSPRRSDRFSKYVEFGPKVKTRNSKYFYK